MRTSRETIGERSITHGQTVGKNPTPAYRSWCCAKNRCFNPDHDKYPLYGGRGITMCDRWRESFIAFFEDMGAPPPGTSLDRIDVNGNYEPGNCRWATWRMQMSNMRSNVFLEFEGERLTMANWARKLGMDPRNFHREHKRMGRTLSAIIAHRRAIGKYPSAPGLAQAHRMTEVAKP